MIQVQRDRFLHNWKKMRPEDEYPRYERVVNLFYSNLASFETFLAENDLGEMERRQYEMTYINHIPQGSGWDSLKDVGDVFPDFMWRGGDRFLPDLGGLNWTSVFTMPDNAGRLRAVVGYGVNRSDNRPVLTLELTARGIGAERSEKGMAAWFDLAHEWIVRGFVDLTSRDMQDRVWGRKA